MEFSTEGIVIREMRQGENDKLLTILTPQGKIYALAKGVKKISSKNAPACQLFVYSEYELMKKNGRNIVKTAVLKDLFYDMRADISRYSLACYFAEVISHVAVENNDESETLRLFLNCLYAMSNKKDIPLSLIKSAFELKLMCIIGFMPDFEACSYCSEETKIGRNNVFSFEDACIICENCVSKLKNRKEAIPFSCTISEGTAEAIMFISNAAQSKMLSFKISDEALSELSFVTENYLIHKTERTYETLKIYKSIINSLGEK